MRPFRGAGDHYDCSIPLFYISLINLGLSIASLSLAEFDVVKASSRINDPYLVEILSHLFSGVTVIISITTIFATLFSVRKLIILLLIWDAYRFLFAVWAATGARSDKECVYYVFLVGWLMLCFLAEMSHLAQPISVILQDNGIYNSQGRFDVNYPPRYQDVPPPPYSPRASSSSSSVQPTSLTVFTITEGRSAETASFLEILPPAYESLGFEKSSRF